MTKSDGFHMTPEEFKRRGYEVIDWIAALLRAGISADQLESHIPFLGSLLKNEQDTEAFQNFAERGGNLPKHWSDLGPKYNQ